MRRFIVEVPDKIDRGQLEVAVYDGFYNRGAHAFTVSEVLEENQYANGKPRMTTRQRDALWRTCGNYNVPFNESDYYHTFDLPEGWVAGWIGGINHSAGMGSAQTIYVGVSPEGEVNS